MNAATLNINLKLNSVVALNKVLHLVVIVLIWIELTKGKKILNSCISCKLIQLVEFCHSLLTEISKILKRFYSENYSVNIKTTEIVMQVQTTIDWRLTSSVFRYIPSLQKKKKQPTK